MQLERSEGLLIEENHTMTVPSDHGPSRTPDENQTAHRRESVAHKWAALAGDHRKLRRHVLSLAWPVIGENLLETLLGVIDTLLVAYLGATALAGVGSALQVSFFLISFLSALAVGSAVLVAQAIGSGDLIQACQLARQSLLWSVVLSIPLAIIGLLMSEPIISIFALESDVTAIGVEYLRINMGTIVVLIALFIGSGVLRGAGDSRTPMIVTAIANVINIVLAYGLIYGRFWLPELGAVGSAWGTFIARSFALLLLIGAMWRGRNGLTIAGYSNWHLDLKVLKRVLYIGVPAAFEQLLISSGFFILSVVVAHLGTLTLAAHRIIINAVSLSFLPGIGLGVAATALVGQSVGARRIAEGAAATRIALRWAVGWMSILGILFLIFAPQVMQLFSSDPDVIAIGVGGLRACAFVQPFWAMMFVYAGALRGTGDTRFPLFATGGGIWATVGLSYVLLHTLGGGLTMAWIAFIILAPLIALLYWWRFRSVFAAAHQAESA